MFTKRKLKKRRRLPVTLHEAAHFVVAQEIGLPVEWASIDPGYDAEEKLHYPAAVKITDESKQDRAAVAVAQAAPSFLDVGDEGMNDYAIWEAVMGFMDARKVGHNPISLAARAAEIVTRRERSIHRLAARLMREGTVKAA
jgi:hypothetical protein